MDIINIKRLESLQLTSDLSGAVVSVGDQVQSGLSN